MTPCRGAVAPWVLAELLERRFPDDEGAPAVPLELAAIEQRR